MGILDAENLIKKLDPNGMLQSINDLPDQIETCWQQMQKFAILTHYVKTDKILILGMGGSAIGGDLIASLALSYSKVPIFIHRDYEIPNFVDSNTLVIAVSYSGNTEETLDGFTKAGEKGAKLIAVSTGGKIESLCRKYQAPMFKVFYGSAPRAALGYLFTAVLAVLNKLDFITLGQNEIKELVRRLREYQKKVSFEIPTSQNPAKKLSQRLENKIPVIMASGTLSVVARRWKTQFNENSKQFAFFEIFPELCHNMVVGLDFPKKVKNDIFIILLESEFDHPRNRLRQSVIHQILRKKGINYEVIIMDKTDTPLIEMFQVILLGEYTSYYLAILNNVDPTPNEMIDFLKAKLAESK